MLYMLYIIYIIYVYMNINIYIYIFSHYSLLPLANTFCIFLIEK